MKWIPTIGVALTVACTPTASGLDEIIALEVRTPSSQQIALGDSTRLDAVAITARGEEAPDAQVVWAILDVDSGNVVITLDTLSGVAVGIAIGTTRVQARVETLRSDPLTISVIDSATTPLALRRPQLPLDDPAS